MSKPPGQTPGQTPGRTAGRPPGERPSAEQLLGETSTRDRLLRAAVAVFASQGFANASVRDICARAETNVAAVNYHFGSKERLYDEAIDCARAMSNAANPFVLLDEARDFWSNRADEERLQLFIQMMLAHSFDEQGERSPLLQIMCQELADPTPAFARQFEISIQRVWDAFRDICRSLMSAGASDDEVHLAALSVMAQCQHPGMAYRMLELCSPGLVMDAATRARYAEHVYRFSLAGLKSFRPAD